MGAWGAGAFDNDTAGDWACELEDTEDISFVEQTLADVLNAPNDYLDSDGACNGLAACEVIARLKGNWGVRDASTEDVDEWVKAHPHTPSKELVQKALAVIDRVRGESSELRDLWEEGDPAEWNAAVEDLRKRVAN